VHRPFVPAHYQQDEFQDSITSEKNNPAEGPPAEQKKPSENEHRSISPEVFNQQLQEAFEKVKLVMR
jgi:hypothetical protein